MPKVKAAHAHESAPADATPSGAPVRRFLRLRAVEAATGLRKTTLYLRISRGEFPAPVPLGEGRNSPVGWPEDEIALWEAKRIAKRDTKRGR
jgi:prophage regulatory protein